MAANDTYFNDPRSRNFALGLQTKPKDLIWLDPKGNQKHAIQNGGIIDPRKYVIDPSTRIYSFTSVTSEIVDMLGRDWWVDRKALDQIIRFASVNKISIGYAVRLLCCVPIEWGNKLNFLIPARTKVALAAWRGLANSAAGSADLVSPTGRVIGRVGSETPARNDIAAWRCLQLHIPGLGGFYFQGADQKQALEARKANALSYLSLDGGPYQLEDAATWVYA